MLHKMFRLLMLAFTLLVFQSCSTKEATPFSKHTQEASIIESEKVIKEYIMRPQHNKPTPFPTINL